MISVWLRWVGQTIVITTTEGVCLLDRACPSHCDELVLFCVRINMLSYRSEKYHQMTRVVLLVPQIEGVVVRLI